MMDTTITLEWDLPQGSGPETIVDSYIISISPSPLSHPAVNWILFSPWNVTLAHNITYSINISAVNCVGESATFVLPNLEYSEDTLEVRYEGCKKFYFNMPLFVHTHN